MRILVTLTLLILSFQTFAIPFELTKTEITNTVLKKTELKKTLDTALKEVRLKHNIPTMAVAVISSGELVYAEGFGSLTYDSLENTKATPATEKTLFRIASISKLFTAQAIMQLVEKHKIKLDDTIGQYLPSFKNSTITIRQLLTHSSGLKDKIRPVSVQSNRSTREYLDAVSKTISKNTKQANFNYSDTGFNILGNIISSVSGIKFEEYINNNILSPTHMANSGYFNGKNNLKAEAEPTHKGEVINIARQRPFDAAFNPSEGLISNVFDLSQWLKATLAQDTDILQKKTYREMVVPQIKTTWGNIYVGLGWQVFEENNEIVARHAGSVRGYKSLLLSYPKDKRAIILLTNSSTAPRWEITDLITEKLKQTKFWQ